MKKRGATHVDWAVSLALFLLYIGWFFIFINPVFIKDNTQQALISTVEDNFKTEYRWTVRRLPLIIYPNVSNNYLPIIVNFNYNWTKNNTLLGNYLEFSLDNSKLIFLGNVSNETRIFWLINSDENYTAKSYLKDLNANATVVTTGKDLKVVFSNSIYESISYKDKVRLNKTELYVEDDEIEVNNNYTNITDSVAIYRISTQGLNHTSYIFAKNSLIWNIIRLNMNGSYNFKINAELYDYENYYASNNYYGVVNYSAPGCKQFNNDYLNFYNSNSISFIFNTTAVIRFCYANDTINLNMTFSLENETYYKIYLHEGNFSNISIREYAYKFGAIEREKGLYLEKINNINYDTIKTRWNYPSVRDFKMTIWNLTSADLINRTDLTIKEIGRSPNVEDVSAKEWDDFVITKEAMYYPALVNIKTW